MLTTRKRILVLSLAYYPLVGGAEIAIKEITDRIRDIDFDMITMRFDKSHLKFEAIDNVHVHRIGWGGNYINKILFVPLAALKAWRLNRKNHYRKFWAMMTYMLFPISIMRLFGNTTPYALTLQDGDPFEHVFRRSHIRVFAPLLRKGIREAEVVQTISNFLADWAKKFGYMKKVEVIPNGVDVDKFQNQESRIRNQDKTILITTSRLVKKNGVGDVIDALRLLPENISFKILGTGPLMSELKMKVKSLNLKSRVNFLGYIPQSEIPNYLHKADIFIRPSLSEGMGSSFVEAMAAGLPVIATPVGGIPDFLFDPDRNKNHHSTGLFVNIHDSKDIARQVARLIKDSKLRETLINNGRRLVREKYDWNLIAGEMKSKVFNNGKF
ncbi:MAG: glycosyltransferase family 4 protein [Patescibacteria group bacterium]